ncbi:MAG: transposase [Aquificaceae bacterium]
MDNRRAKGFIKSLFDILKLDLPIPDHTTISRRGRKLNIQRNCVSSRLDEMRRVELLIWCKVLSIMDMLYVAESYAC